MAREHVHPRLKRQRVLRPVRRRDEATSLLIGGMRRLFPAMGLAVLAGCSSHPPPPPAPTPPSAPAPTAPSSTPIDLSVPPVDFKNPGGMWMPSQLDRHAAKLKELGLTLDPAALTDPMAFPLGAIVWLGGCTGSFVSGTGLIITNHHCATGALQFNTTDENNLIRDGFYATRMKDEPSNGPAARVYVTQKFEYVTARVRDGIDTLKDDQKRYEIIEDRQKALIAECEKGRPDIRCSVVSFFGGETFVRIEQLELRDIRLVHAPAEGIGNYGGEIDNWRWPRHSGDYSFFRAYVGKDGKPADYSPDNVPYRPRHHLKVASTPLKAGDLVMVAGYPGRTTRLRTAQEVKEAVDWYYPRRLKLTDDYLTLLRDLREKHPELQRKSQRLYRGLSNVRTNTQGMLDGLTKGGLSGEKAAQEKALRAWVQNHPEHAAATDAIDALSQHYSKYRARRDADAALSEVMGLSTLLGAADTIVQMAEERPKPDAARDPRFQARNHKRIIQRQQQAQRSYDRRLDAALFALALERAARLPKKDRPEILALVVGKGVEPTPGAIAAAVERLYDATKLGDVDERIRLLEKGTLASLKRSQDPFVQLALKVRPAVVASEARGEGYEGAVVLDRPRFSAALRAQQDGVLAPDANSTLRLTYGTVRGYRPPPGTPIPDDALLSEGKRYYPFSRLSGMVKKHTGEPPFDAPDATLEAAQTPARARYVHAPFGEVPVDFLSDLDITGGNSGSPTLNGAGELVGLAFDGNYEAMASDWIFIPEITRSIHVDLRYVLWTMDRVYGASRLLEELGVADE